MWRLIGIALILVAFLGFVGLNLDNRCVISFGFWKTPEPVPVFFPVFTAFVLGILCSIPFAVSAGLKRSRKSKNREDPAQKKKRGKDEALPEIPVTGGPYDID
jgi:predicted tellurium resistance membrane protein TerC